MMHSRIQHAQVLHTAWSSLYFVTIRAWSILVDEQLSSHHKAEHSYYAVPRDQAILFPI